MYFYKPIYLSICIPLCNLLSYGCAGIHYWLVSAGIFKIDPYILVPRTEIFKKLRNLWYTELVRRMISVLVRSFLRPGILGLVNFNIPLPANSGCILTICHTPWKRLLVQWCLDNNFAIIVAYDKKTDKRKLVLRAGTGFKELREIMNCLKQNGRIIMVADTFNHLDNCQVKFLDKDRNVSLLPVRLAKIAEVPLILAIPVLINGTVHIEPGPPFDLATLNADYSTAMQKVISLMESEIRKCPWIWVHALP
jgi:hypothetical protein